MGRSSSEAGIEPRRSVRIEWDYSCNNAHLCTQSAGPKFSHLRQPVAGSPASHATAGASLTIRRGLPQPKSVVYFTTNAPTAASTAIMMIHARKTFADTINPECAAPGLRNATERWSRSTYSSRMEVWQGSVKPYCATQAYLGVSGTSLRDLTTRRSSSSRF
jgi:hypothetical protein